MRMAIDWKYKHLYVTCDDLVDAGWFGFDFARSNPDLVANNWLVLFYPEPENTEMPTDGYQLLDDEDSDSIGDILRKGQIPNHCTTCTCPPKGEA